MFGNPLYYFPVEANRLYHVEKGSEERKRLIAEFSRRFASWDFDCDEVISVQYSTKIKRLLIAVSKLPFLCLGSAAAMQIVDMIDSNADVPFVIFFCICILSSVITIALTLCIVNLRRKLVQHLLESYTPVCEEFGEQLLSEIGSICLDTLWNRENIEYILAEREDGKDFCELDACVCISCLEVTEDSDITQFDKNDSAVCPHCGEKALIGKAQCMSDELLQRLNQYATAVKSLK